MGNDERRPPAHQVGETLLNHGFTFRVEARRGLVENQNPGIGQNRPGDRNALALTAGEFHPTFANYRVVAFRKTLGKFIDPGDPAGFQNFHLRRQRPGELDILANRPVKQEGFLQHHPELRTIVAKLYGG